ncbi:MAG: DUF1294 domain-containing protein [Clostridia bacterium]
MNLYLVLILYFIAVNILGFCTMYYDKKLAIKHSYRVCEKTLLVIALLLGGIGVYTGMFTFRHKTKHMKFLVFVPICIVLNAISIYLILSYVYVYLTV